MFVERPASLEGSPKKKIVPITLSLQDDDLEDHGVAMTTSVDSSDVDIADIDDLKTPDDLNTPEALDNNMFDGELEWEESM